MTNSKLTYYNINLTITLNSMYLIRYVVLYTLHTCTMCIKMAGNTQ